MGAGWGWGRVGVGVGVGAGGGRWGWGRVGVGSWTGTLGGVVWGWIVCACSSHLRMLILHLIRHSPPQPRRIKHVRLIDDRQLAPPRLRRLERELERPFNLIEARQEGENLR